jgi:hypothetical protein
VPLTFTSSSGATLSASASFLIVRGCAPRLPFSRCQMVLCFLATGLELAPIGHGLREDRFSQR